MGNAKNGTPGPHQKRKARARKITGYHQASIGTQGLRVVGTSLDKRENWKGAACNLPKAHKKDVGDTQGPSQGGKRSNRTNANGENWAQKISPLQKSARL